MAVVGEIQNGFLTSAAFQRQQELWRSKVLASASLTSLLRALQTQRYLTVGLLYITVELLNITVELLNMTVGFSGICVMSLIIVL